MLTFWGRPRNQHIFDHARERWVLYVPLLLLAVLSTWVGGKGIGIRDFLERSVTETNAVCQTLTARPDYPGFDTAWPATLPRDEEANNNYAAAVPAVLTPSQEVMEHGRYLTHAYAGYAWLAGIVIGFLVYVRGPLIPDALLRLPPVRWVNVWLYRRMYFDELYHLVAVGAVTLCARFSRAFDTHILDRLVDGVAAATRGLSRLAGQNDEYVIDGAVNGLGDLAQEVGVAVRAPQTGRVRGYVTLLLASIAVATAAAVLAVLLLR
jgi:NADH-quinone oxidoreductase subunit L